MHFPLEQSNTNSKVKATAFFLKHLGFCKTEGSSDSPNYRHIIATHQFSVRAGNGIHVYQKPIYLSASTVSLG